jgi:hypothetical protein
MNLLHPWALGVGAAAVALPVIIHWLTRPRPVTVPLSTLRFVREAVQQKRARHRLRDWIILLLRAAAVALLAWAFARPLIGAKPLIADAPGDAVRVVILDRSQSMAAVSNGVQAFERARPAAAKHLAYSPGRRVNLIFAGAKPIPVFQGPSSNFAAVQEALATAKPLPENLNLKAALERAGEMLAKSAPETRKELIVISDFQRTNWSAADFSPLPKETLIQFESAAPKETPANLAILRVAPQGRVEQNRETRIDVEVGNFSNTPRDVQVEVNVGGATVRVTGHCPPAARTTLSGECVLPASGWFGAEAKLAGAPDALAADDVRPFVLNVRPAPTFALLTREPAAPKPTSSHYLERALAPIRPRDNRPAEKVVRIDSTTFDRESLGAADLIVIDHAGRLTNGSTRLLASMLRRGRPLLYVAAEPADATNLGQLADAAGADLKMPVQFMPPPAGQGRRDLFIASTRKESGLFNVFGDGLNAALAPLRFAGGLATRKLEGGLADDVVATYSDQSAAVVVTACGAGTIAVINASLADSSMPGSPVFVSLTGELVNRLLSRSKSADTVASGEAAVSYLPPEAAGTAGLAIQPPGAQDANAAANLGELVEESGSVIWRWPAAGTPGVYRVKRGAADVFALASAVPAQEADLQSIDPAVLKDRLAGGRTVAYQNVGEDDQQRDTRWAWLAAMCAACMICEFGALKLFRT